MIDRLALGEIKSYSIFNRTYERFLMPANIGALAKDGGVVRGSSVEDLTSVTGYENLDKA